MPEFLLEIGCEEIPASWLSSLQEQLGRRLLETPGGRAYLPAYDWCLKSSHAFNVLDAPGAISVTERAGMILWVRKLACAVAKAYVDAVTGVDPAGDGAEAARG